MSIEAVLDAQAKERLADILRRSRFKSWDNFRLAAFGTNDPDSLCCMGCGDWGRVHRLFMEGEQWFWAIEEGSWRTFNG